MRGSREWLVEEGLGSKEEVWGWIIGAGWGREFLTEGKVGERRGSREVGKGNYRKGRFE